MPSDLARPGTCPPGWGHHACPPSSGGWSAPGSPVVIVHCRLSCHVLLLIRIAISLRLTRHVYWCMCIHRRLSVQDEWLLPNRRLEVPDENNLLMAAQHLISHTSRHPGLTLEFDADARDMIDSYPVMLNTRCSKLRTDADPDAAAEEGTIRVLP